MTLVDLAEDEVAEVVSLPPDVAASRRMQALGIFVGRKIRFLRAAPFAGPLLVQDQVTGGRIMIARAMAEQVQVNHGRPSQT